MASILQRLGAFRNKAISHTVDSDNGPQEFRFYPPRMRVLISGRMREIVEPITRALSTIFSKNDQDASRQQEVSQDGTVTTFVQGLNPEVIAVRDKQRGAAIRDALASLLDDKTRYHVGELLADSLRDEFSTDEAQRARQVREFMDEVDLPTLAEMLKGYFKALAPVLDASGNSILSDLRNVVKREVGRATGRAGESDEDLGEILEGPSPSPSESQDQPQ